MNIKDLGIPQFCSSDRSSHLAIPLQTSELLTSCPSSQVNGASLYAINKLSDKLHLSNV